jgi:hypothetical protein
MTLFAATGLLACLLAQASQETRAQEAPGLAKPGEPFCDQRSTPVAYAEIPRVTVVVGELVDLDENTSCSGADDCFAFPQISLRVQHSFSGKVPRQVVIDMQLPGTPWSSTSMPAKGDQVVVTMRRESRVRDWTCGRLRPCDKRPRERWLGIEIYKRVNWP